MKRWLLIAHEKFESFIVSVLLVLLMIVILVATAEFVFLMFDGLWTRLQEIDSVEFMGSEMHVVFAGFLVILLGIELMETVKMYLTEHVIHVEIVFLVAMIAVGRHVIEIDYAEAKLSTLLGISALVLALSAGYYLLKRSGPPPRTHMEESARRES